MPTTNLEDWDRTRDAEQPFHPGGPSIIAGTLPGNAYDNPNRTWREYGHRVGVWRMFAAFEKAGVPTSCTMNAKMGRQRPAVVRHAVDRGWELVAHNYVQTDLLADHQLGVAAERRVIRETLRVYGEGMGRPARGWLLLAPQRAGHRRHPGGGRAFLSRRPAASLRRGGTPACGWAGC